MTELDDAVMMPGSATPEHVVEQDPDEYPVAVLWLPNVETWRGWEMKRVARKNDPKPRGPAGFRR